MVPLLGGVAWDRVNCHHLFSYLPSPPCWLWGGCWEHQALGKGKQWGDGMSDLAGFIAKRECSMEQS